MSKLHCQRVPLTIQKTMLLHNFLLHESALVVHFSRNFMLPPKQTFTKMYFFSLPLHNSANWGKRVKVDLLRRRLRLYKTHSPDTSNKPRLRDCSSRAFFFLYREVTILFGFVADIIH